MSHSLLWGVIRLLQQSSPKRGRSAHKDEDNSLSAQKTLLVADQAEFGPPGMEHPFISHHHQIALALKLLGK